MGVSYYIVNTAKRQYLSAGSMFLSGDRLDDIMAGFCGRALALLIRGDNRPGPQIAVGDGYWAGDAIYTVGDSYHETVVHSLSLDPHSRNVEAFEILRDVYLDISPALVGHLCEWHRCSRTYVEASDKGDGCLFLNLINLIEQFELPTLRHTLVDYYGAGWRRRYDRLAKAQSQHRKLWDLSSIRDICGWPLRNAHATIE